MNNQLSNLWPVYSTFVFPTYVRCVCKCVMKVTNITKYKNFARRHSVTGQAISCNSNWWWCIIAIFKVVGHNRYFHWKFCVIGDLYVD